MEIKFPTKIDSLSPAHKIKISVALAAIIITMLIVLVIYPLWQQKIPENNKKLIELQKKEQLLKIKLSQLQAYKTLPKEIKMTVKNLQTMLVDPDFPVDFLDFLDNLARQNNLTIDYSPTGRGKSDKEILYRLNLTGNLQDTLRFITQLENGPFLISLNKIQMQKNSENNILLTDITIKVFTK